MPASAGFLNATFGNAAELIIALLILSHGPEMYPLVKATITGSIIGNALLVLGMAILFGGLSHSRQVFNRTAASMGATLLALASVGLIMPTVYYYLFRAGTSLSPAELHNVEYLSEEIAVVLGFTYLLSLIFSLRTHQHLFGGADEESKDGEHHQAEWSRTTSLIMLLGATAGVAGMAHILVGSVELAGRALGMNQVFVGVIVVAIVGNAAEHSTAVLMAMKNKMDLALHIAVGSSIQIALFVAPVLVFASMFMGHSRPLDLHFTPLELIALVISPWPSWRWSVKTGRATGWKGRCFSRCTSSWRCRSITCRKASADAFWNALFQPLRILVRSGSAFIGCPSGQPQSGALPAAA